MSRVLALVFLLAAWTGCTSDDSGPAPEPSATPTPSAAAPPPPRPERLDCSRISYTEAVAPADTDRRVNCVTPHTSQTYAVGDLDTVVDGHLLAVDSKAVMRQITDKCPPKLPRFLGATNEQLRLTMLRGIWFTSSVKQSDAGANWYRCDVIAIAGNERLASVTGSFESALSTPAGRTTYGMCGTAGPDEVDFQRVLCSEPHTWRAIDTVNLPGKKYPGEDEVQAAGQGPCDDAARAIAEDALDYEWGYEWPTREQWGAGQEYGVCWAPSAAG